MKMATEIAPLPGDSGLLTGVNVDTLFIRVPKILSDDHCMRVSSELCRIAQERPGVSRWNVDLSEITVLPFFLAGTLGRLCNTLMNLGCEVRFLRTSPAE